MLPKSTSLDGGGRVVNFNIFILRNTYFILRVSESELLTYLKLNFSKFVINLYLRFQSGKVGPGRVPGRQEP